MKEKKPKNLFLAFFQRFFGHALLRPVGNTLIFCQMKGLMKIHICDKFHLYTICGSKVTHFQIVSWQCSSHEMGPFWGFLGPFSPKYCSNSFKFGPEVVHHETKSVYEQCFKIINISTNGTYPKFSILVHFWAQFTPGKRNIFPKTKFFPQTTSFGLSDDTSPKSQINRRILIKIFKNTHFLGPKWA